MTNEHQDGEREYHAILKDAYWVNDFRSPNIGGHIQGDTKGRFENGEWVSTSTVFEHLGDDIYRTRYSVYKVEWRDDRGEPSEPISGYTYTRARLDKAAVEPVPVDVERRKAIAGFNGCLKAKRGEFCQSCVGQATHYAYQDEDDRRKVPFTYPLASLPAPRDLGLLGKPKEKR